MPVFPFRLRFRKEIDIHILIVTAIFGAWLSLVLVSPFLVPPGHLTDLSGAALRMDNPEKIEGINPIAWLVYSAGDANCHQIRERSFFLNDNQMPFCSRDVGLFLGAFVGSFAALVLFLRLRWQYVTLSILPLAIDVAAQELTDYESTNEIRLITGIVTGGACAIFICHQVAMSRAGDEPSKAEASE